MMTERAERFHKMRQAKLTSLERRHARKQHQRGIFYL